MRLGALAERDTAPQEERTGFKVHGTRSEGKEPGSRWKEQPQRRGEHPSTRPLSLSRPDRVTFGAVAEPEEKRRPELSSVKASVVRNKMEKVRQVQAPRSGRDAVAIFAKSRCL